MYQQQLGLHARIGARERATSLCEHFADAHRHESEGDVGAGGVAAGRSDFQ
jgi:hypothetical protein